MRVNVVLLHLWSVGTDYSLVPQNPTVPRVMTCVNINLINGLEKYCDLKCDLLSFS